MKEKPVVCVIDGTTTALLAAILFKNRKIDVCIIEEKDDALNPDIYTARLDERLSISLILGELTISKIYSVRLPYIMLDNRHMPYTWWRYIKVKKKIYRLLDNFSFHYHDAVFFGAQTSTLLAFLPPESIVQLDHGVEVMQRMKEQEKKKENFLKKYIKKILYNITSYNGGIFGKNCGYTMAVCKEDSFHHIDYKDFENKIIEQTLLSAKDYVYKTQKKFALLLPETQGEFARLIKSTPGEENCKLDFEKIFNSMIEAVPGIDYLVVKFHPALYYMERGKAQDYINIIRAICKAKGIICWGLDEFLGSSIGNALPAEIIVRSIKFSAVIAMYSTTLVNIAEENSDVKCYNVTGLVKEYDDTFAGYDKINPYVIQKNVG